jgi:hypothetical protein
MKLIKITIWLLELIRDLVPMIMAGIVTYLNADDFNNKWEEGMHFVCASTMLYTVDISRQLRKKKDDK